MPILTVILILVAIGVIMWLINSYIPMSAGIKKILNIVVVIFVILWLLKLLGVFGFLNGVKV